MTTTEDIKKQILQYLVRHPQAMDSVKGIAQWWIARQVIEGRIDEVFEAISLLATDGLVKENTKLDGTVVYSLNRDRLVDIKKMTET